MNSRSRRAIFPNSAALTINEPVRDLKGKKRALPENNSEEEELPASTSTKRPRTASAYSLRSRTDTTTTQALEMPRKKTLVLRTHQSAFTEVLNFTVQR